MNDTNITLTLDELNIVERRLYMGGIVLVCAISCMGFAGNGLVIFIYFFKFKPSNHRLFIISLAVLDFIASSIVMPLVVYSFMHLFTYYNSVMCKISTWFNYFISISSGDILLVIEVDRYFKICLPHKKQMSATVAKVMCVFATATALLFAVPGYVMYGSNPVATRVSSIIGYECNVNVDLTGTWYPVLWNGGQLLGSLALFVVLSCLYGMIAKVIWNRSQFFLQKKSHIETRQKTSDEDSNVGESNNSEIKTVSKSVEKAYQVWQNKCDKSTTRKFDKVKRTTLMLFIITFNFLLSYVLHAGLRVVYYMNPDW
ncbi:hypothetical protein DPMN_160238 [Dreissena polymorpha]|uniref:G-protein coupled receptors family 1 profile domain-containing protein n=1 Tax=Dreissena polymorpha TaxID=45954 RepID=A0A9D4EMU6_DREPO|nr:hypothetical protein DPMN_160238 [Dreissena polymorpha]